ncbi:MAG: HAD family phosphatase [Lactobacillus sp.]|jgi:HAD superfamily hydrolase (TIGR01509 family)|nr:HAD family phosphatase [Lactobacillus sp.]
MKTLCDLDLSAKKVVIFDMDGTLIDSVGIWNVTDCKLIYNLSKHEVSEEQVQLERDSFITSNNTTDIYLAYCGYLAEKYKIDMPSEEILKLRWGISDEFLERDVDYRKDADLVLKELKRQGYKLALATITTQRQLDIYKNINKNTMSKANIADVFDLVISKEDVLHKKPHPEIYLKVLEQLGVSADEALVFEDSLVGVQAAKNAGIEVVSVCDKYSDADRKEIDDLSDYKIKNYAEVFDIL